MLEKLILRNFQCHRKLTLDLNHPIVVLMGPSDCGKTAALCRSLRWLALGQPSGNDFIHWDHETGGAALHLDGHTIVRKRGPRRNTYTLDGTVYKAFGSEVPEPVAQLLNLSRDNFALQHDEPFWLTLSPGQASKALNRIINLDVIDRVLARAAKEVRTQKVKVEIHTDRVQSMRQELTNLDWVERCEQDRRKIEALEDRRQECQSRRERLDNLVAQITSKRARLDLLQQACAAGEKVLEVQRAHQHTHAIHQRLTDLVEKIHTKEERLCAVCADLNETEKKLKKHLRGKCPLCGRTGAPTP